MVKTKVVNLYKEAYDVYIGRKGKDKDGYFGNPIKLTPVAPKGSTLVEYKKYFYERLENDSEFKRRIHDLKGKTLGCFCAPNPCHGDIIAEYLNSLKFKILVCGSRDTKDKEFVFKTLDFLTSKKDLSDIEIVQGGQKSYDKSLGINYGADYFAKLWAQEKDVKMTEFKAPWEGLVDMPKSKLTKKSNGSYYWKGAGMYRNKQMLDYGPDACVGFLVKSSANSGTKHMLKLCEKAGILTKFYYI